MQSVTEEISLLEAIAAAPDDDAPRLVYADWLLQQDDPRGAFIQLQCRLAATPDDERRRAIRIAENKLLAEHAATWTASLRALLPPEDSWFRYEFRFERGFVAHATLSVACVPMVAALCDAAPQLRSLKIGGSMLSADGGGGIQAPPPPDFRALARCPIERLELGAAGGRALAEALAKAPFERLRALRFGGFGKEARFPELARFAMGDAGVVALAGAPGLAKLTELELDGCGITTDGVQTIAHAKWRLDELSLGWNQLEPGFAPALLGPATARATRLGLMGVAHEASDLVVLGGKLAELRELDFELAHLGPAGIAALGKALAVPLARLRVERNALGDAGAIALASAPAFASLRSLEMGHNRIGHKGAAAIASSPHLAGLERLTMNEPRWKADTQALLAASATLASARIYLRGHLIAKDTRTTARAAATKAAEAKAKPKSKKPAPKNKPAAKPKKR